MMILVIIDTMSCIRNGKLRILTKSEQRVASTRETAGDDGGRQGLNKGKIAC